MRRCRAKAPAVDEELVSKLHESGAAQDIDIRSLLSCEGFGLVSYPFATLQYSSVGVTGCKDGNRRRQILSADVGVPREGTRRRATGEKKNNADERLGVFINWRYESRLLERLSASFSFIHYAIAVFLCKLG